MKTQINNNSAIFLCGHGSRSDSYSQNLINIKKKLEKRIKLKVFSCFIEINNPSLEECLSKYSEKFDKIFIFPFLIFEGKHFKKDIFELVETFNKKPNNIILIDKISLLDEILPITLNILKKKIRKGKKTVLVTSSSYSKEKSVLLSLKKYTSALSHELTLSHSFFHYAGEEQIVIKQLKLVDSDKLSVLLHPIFLFEGFLYSKNTKCFFDNFADKVLVTNPLIKEDEIFEIMVKKLIDNIFN